MNRQSKVDTAASLTHIRPLAEILYATADWKDLTVPEAIIQQIREIARSMKHKIAIEEAEAGDQFANGLRDKGVTALFSGASGTGKTLAAIVLANQLGLDLYRVYLSRVISKFIGETEKNLARLFAAAENSGAILFFDEADALFGKRGEVTSNNDRHANLAVSYLLQRVESFQGLVILSTSFRNDIDHAFLRRIQFVIDFPSPVESRQDIWDDG